MRSHFKREFVSITFQMIVAYSKTEFRIMFNLDGFTWKCPAEADLVSHECICLERVDTSQGFPV